MVLRVFPDKILQCRAVVNDFSFNPPIPPSAQHKDMYAPKYHKDDGNWDATKQLDPLAPQIPSTEDGGWDGQPTYRKDGY